MSKAIKIEGLNVTITTYANAYAEIEKIRSDFATPIENAKNAITAFDADLKTRVDAGDYADLATAKISTQKARVELTAKLDSIIAEEKKAIQEKTKVITETLKKIPDTVYPAYIAMFNKGSWTDKGAVTIGKKTEKANSFKTELINLSIAFGMIPGSEGKTVKFAESIAVLIGSRKKGEMLLPHGKKTFKDRLFAAFLKRALEKGQIKKTDSGMYEVIKFDAPATSEKAA